MNVNDITQEDMKCFSDVSTADAKKVGLNHSGRYKVKKRGCMTKTRYCTVWPKNAVSPKMILYNQRNILYDLGIL